MYLCASFLWPCGGFWSVLIVVHQANRQQLPFFIRFRCTRVIVKKRRGLQTSGGNPFALGVLAFRNLPKKWPQSLGWQVHNTTRRNQNGHIHVHTCKRKNGPWFAAHRPAHFKAYMISPFKSCSARVAVPCHKQAPPMAPAMLSKSVFTWPTNKAPFRILSTSGYKPPKPNTTHIIFHRENISGNNGKKVEAGLK